MVLWDYPVSKNEAEAAIGWAKVHPNHRKMFHGVMFSLVAFNIPKPLARRVAREFRTLGYRAQVQPARWEPTGASPGRGDLWIRRV